MNTVDFSDTTLFVGNVTVQTPLFNETGDNIVPITYLRELLVAASVTGLVPNIANMVILARHSRPLNSHSMIVFNQCFCGMLICLCTLVENILRYEEKFFANEPIKCAIVATSMAQKSFFVDVTLNMMMITSSRFLAVYRPSTFPTMFTRKRTAIKIAAMLVVVVFLALVQCVYTTVAYLQTNVYSFCTVYFQHGGANVIDISLGVSVAILLVMLPCAYSYIVLQAKRKRSLATNTQRRNKSSLTVTSFWIVLSFLASYIVYYICRYIARFSLGNFDDETKKHFFKASVYSVLPIVLNCTLDPLMYAVRLADIRAGYSSCWRRATHKRAANINMDTSLMDM